MEPGLDRWYGRTEPSSQFLAAGALYIGLHDEITPVRFEPLKTIVKAPTFFAR